MFSAFMCTKFTIWQIPSECWISKYMNITCVSIKKKKAFWKLWKICLK